MRQILIIILSILLLIIIGLYYKRQRIYERFQDNKTIVYKLTGHAGFFSTFFSIATAYLYAKKDGYNFAIDNDTWHYTYKNGWRDYFTSLDIYNKDMHTGEIIYRSHPGVIPWGDEQQFRLEEYVDAINDIFKPNEEIIQKARKYMETLGNDYYAIYVRRGDKAEEETILDLPDILNYTDIRENCKVLFIQTDDYTAVEKFQEMLPNCAVHSMTPKNKKGATYDDIIKLKPDELKNDVYEMLIAALVFINAKKAWTEHRSNVGRFLKLYPYKQNQNIFYYPASEKDNQTLDTLVKSPAWT